MLPRRNQAMQSHPCSSHMYSHANYMPNVVNAESNYSKKSYNYMASPNYLQYENTYQKYKNHMKNVIPANDINGATNQMNLGRSNVDYLSGSTENIRNTVDQASSDDEGGFQCNGSKLRTQFNYAMNGHSHHAGDHIASNVFGGREVEPLLMQAKGHKYEPPHYNCTGPMIPMQNLPNSYSNYANHAPQGVHQHAAHKQQPHYRNVSPQIPLGGHPYAKPLPRIPTHIGMHSRRDLELNFKGEIASVDEGPERSSTEDVSSRQSHSLSSSNEDILKPTAKIGDRGDCASTYDRIRGNPHSNSEWILRSALANSARDQSAYLMKSGPDSKLNSIDLAYIKDLELSSTAGSLCPSTLPPNNREIESCTSFEYHNEAPVIDSPFQREIQRLLDSSSKIPLPVHRMKAAVNGSSDDRVRNGSMESFNEHMPVSGASGNGKHPVGLEAIKEIAKNSTNSDSSHL